MGKIKELLSGKILSIVSGVNENSVAKELKNELRNLSAELAYNEMWFNEEHDKDLIDASIFHREMLLAKYRHLIKRARTPQPAILTNFSQEKMQDIS